MRRLLVLFLLLTACAQTSPTASTSQDDQRTQEAEEESTFEATPSADEPIVEETATEAEPLKFAGTGKMLSKKFSVEGGLVTFQMSHQGASNFAVTLMTAGGEYVELLANVIGDYKGKRAFALGVDEYRMQVEADGPWTIEVRQPLHASGELLPATFSGKADGVSGPFEASTGLVELNMNHKGSSNFAVIVYSSLGEYMDLAANEIGNFQGSYGVSIDPGIYVLDIQADGNWEIAASE